MDRQNNIVAGDDASSLEVSVDTPLPRQKMTNHKSSCNSAMNIFKDKKISYDPNHPHQVEHEYHLVTMMAHAYTPLSLVEGESLRRMFTRLDSYIRPITRSKLTRTLISQKLKKAETDVPSLLYGVLCVVISYDLWMSKMTQDIFSMTSHYTRYHARVKEHIGIPITTSTYGDSLAVTVGNVIN